MDASDAPELGRTMRYWLARACREARERTGQRRAEIALLAGIDPSTLSRFETFQTWPQNVDRVIVAYAYLCEIEDARSLWVQATRSFMKHGGVPLLGELSAAQRALLLAFEAAQRTSTHADEYQSEPISIQSRQAGGRSAHRERRSDPRAQSARPPQSLARTSVVAPSVPIPLRLESLTTSYNAVIGMLSP